jgi:hypothetical protein
MVVSPPLLPSEVLREEYGVLRPPADDKPQAPLTALCLSGGGIRSATFALGVIQGLAEQGVLGAFDYLSTVSGGGYIGAWLTCWKQRAQGIDRVIPRIRGEAPAAPASGPDPIQHLRDYNNYLAPRLGLFSVDTWTLVATVARNMFLNWLVFVPLLLAALMAPRLMLSLARLGETFFAFYGSSGWLNPEHLSKIIPAASAFFFAMAIFNTLRYLPGVGGTNHTEIQFLKYCLLPLVLAAMAFVTNDAWFTGGDSTLAGAATPEAMAYKTLIPAYMATAFAGWLAYLIFCGKSLRERMRLFLPVSAAVLVASWSAGSALWLLIGHIYPSIPWPVYITVALPVLLVALLLAEFLFIGFSSRVLLDKDREWLARAGAWVLLVVVGWTAVCALVLILPDWAFTMGVWEKSLLAAAGASAGWISALGGLSSKTGPGDQNTAGTAAPPPSLAVSIATKLAAPVFAAAFLVGLSILTNWILGISGWGTLTHWDKAAKTWVNTPCPGCAWWDHRALLEGTRWEANFALGVAFLAFGWLMARYINTNTFSLQQMYRNRLIRAYLGASNPSRDANDFTGFAQSDNIALHELDPKLKPFHVVNVTLNLVGGQRLAWQQRKAESFTMTPLHCGSCNLGYRPSLNYGGPRGISLGTAIAISGAAASPAMGYHSSSVIAFIMTLFNARLGCWLGNPGAAGLKTWRQAGPTSAIASIVREAFGHTDDTSAYVYLSDGGHFENLGIYEMVRRRCGYIVVSDAGCDPQFTYEDLGNALRKIRIDMKIPIDFEESFQSLVKRSKRCAMARIRYSVVDGGGEDGYLLYIKPMMRGNEPPDVASYQTDHKDFPHQSTADQFFDESQTESYRMLGVHTAHEISGGWDQSGGIPGLFEYVSRMYLGDSGARAATAGPAS